MNSHDHPSDHRRGSLHPHGIEEPVRSGLGEVPLVELSKVTNGYGAAPALQDVCLKIWPGQFMAIVGPNGGGKTTLLRTVLSMVPNSRGKLLLRGQEPHRASLERIGYVPQLETIDWNFPITVEEVISMGFFTRNRWLGGLRSEERHKLQETMARLNLSGLGKRHIRELSGGQQQA